MIWMILVFILVMFIAASVSGGCNFIGRIVAGVIIISIGTALWTSCTPAVVVGTVVGMVLGAKEKE